jgi:hypothetical protein
MSLMSSAGREGVGQLGRRRCRNTTRMPSTVLHAFIHEKPPVTDEENEGEEGGVKANGSGGRCL